MTTPRLAAALAAALLGVVAPGSAAAERSLPDCDAATDAPADGSYRGVQSATVAEPRLEIVGLRRVVTPDAFGAVIYVSDLSGALNAAAGAKFQLTVKLSSGNAFVVYSRRYSGSTAGSADSTPPDGHTAYGTTAVADGVTAEYDTTRNAVTVSVAFREIEKTGRQARGTRLSSFVASTIGVHASGAESLFDTARFPAHAEGTLAPCRTADGAPTHAEVFPFAPPAGEPPSPTCSDVTDPPDDLYAAGASQASVASDPAIDITGYAVGVVGSDLVAAVRVQALSQEPKAGLGPWFRIELGLGGTPAAPDHRIVVLTGRPASTYSAADPAPFPRMYVSTRTETEFVGEWIADPPLVARLDVASNTVSFALPLDYVSAVAGEPTGTPLRLLSPKADTGVFSDGLWGGENGYALRDTAAMPGAAETRYLWTDETACFPPMPARLRVTGGLRAGYGDPATLTARLTDATGKRPMSGRTVTFTVGSTRVHGVTDGAGTVRAVLRRALVAGRYAVRARFAGGMGLAKAEASATLTVTVEATRLKAARASSRRAVTAVLADDDGTVLARRVVTWVVDGRSRGSSRTDTRGVAVLKGLRPGQTVVATYAGESRRYAASSVRVRT